MTRKRESRPRPETCQNCGSTRVAEYCADCGQHNVDVHVPAREFVRDAVEDGLSLDSRMGRTVLPFLFRPGFLVTEWTSGRRARYSSPLRLFLLTSFAFFLAAGLAGGSDDVEAGLRAAEAESKAEAKDEAPIGIAFRPGQPVPNGTAEQHANLRTQGWVGRKIDDRWKAFEGMTQKEALSRVQVAFREWVPRVTFFLVPASALILLLLWPRRWLSEHVVLSFHLHAVAFTVFTLLLLVRLLPDGAFRSILETLLGLSIPAWFLLALRRVFGQRWRVTVLKGAAAALLYLVALGVGLSGVGALALWFA